MKIMNFNKLLSGGKFKNIIIIAGVIGIAMILISSFTDFKPSESSVDSVEEYRQGLQSSLSSMLGQIEGVGDVSVLLTIENSVEGVYLENNSTKTKDIEPVVRGVVVACEGGDEPVTLERVTDAVTKALNISSAKVCVTKLVN